MSGWRMRNLQLFRKPIFNSFHPICQPDSPRSSRSYHKFRNVAICARASLATLHPTRGSGKTIRSSAPAFVFVSLVGWVLWTAETNALMRNGDCEDVFVLDGLDSESQKQGNDSCPSLKEMPFSKELPFAYPSLTKDNKTRLLILEPGSFDDELKCRLKSVDQLDEHNYEALSYYWGKRPGAITEMSSGQHIHITANCEAALRRLRLQNESRLLWVDAVCINQSDKAERSRQVEIMQEIYTSANRVIIWLGEEIAQDSLALKTLHYLRSRISAEQDLQSLVRLGWYRDKKSGKVLSGGADTSILRENSYEHLINLLRRAWFRRTWVIQEDASARDAIVLCGCESITWEALADVYTRLGDNFLPSLENISAIENARRSRSGPLYMPLFHVLTATSSSRCQGPRDKIFAVKGLAKDWADKRVLETNYEASFEDLFKRFAVADANRNLNLRTLSCASGPGKSTHTKLPSWVPDWRNIENAHPFVRYSDRTKFCASGGMKAEAWHSQDQNILHVKGKKIDTIMLLGRRLNMFGKTAAVFEINSRKIAELENIV
ncbi:Heterokaryon incompatibility protein (HET) domain containing protein [Hyaloscypha variabilis]